MEKIATTHTMQLIGMIDKEREKQGINIQKFAARSGVVRSHYYSMIKNKTVPNIAVLLRMMNVLGLSLFIGSNADTSSKVINDEIEEDSKPLKAERNPIGTTIDKANKSITITINL